MKQTAATAVMQPLPIDVLSIQSQVVYSQVGNTMAVPAMQAQGMRVATIPTVILSNTPHYPQFRGKVMPIEWFNDLLQGVNDRQILNNLRAMLFGYLGSVAIGNSLADWLEQQQDELTNINQLLIDPVMGDVDCGYYVEPELCAVYKNRLLPMATQCTPNLYELQELVGQKLSGAVEIEQAARSLMVGKMQTVLVTSADNNMDQDANIDVLIVEKDQPVRVLSGPKIIHGAKGAGDLFAATVLASQLRQVPLLQAVQNGIDVVYGAFAGTAQRHWEEVDGAEVVRLSAQLQRS